MVLWCYLRFCVGVTLGSVATRFLCLKIMKKRFTKINENQEEINKACTQGVNHRMTLCHEKRGGDFEQHRTGH